MEGERHDDLPKDDASIEVLSESEDSHTRDSEWSIYSPSRSSIAGSEMILIDFQKLSIDSKMAPIVHQDGRQFIERRDLDEGGLPYSAEFCLNGEVWKLSGEDCLLMSPRWYIALVNVEGTVNIDGAIGFDEAVRTLLKHLKVVKVFMDKELEECNKTKSVLVMTLDKLTDESGENINGKRDVILLRMLLRKHGNSLNMDFKHDLRNCSRLSSEIMSTLDNFVTKALKLIQRNEFLCHLNDSSLSNEFINDAIQKALNCHRAQLAAICPSSMKDKLQELPDDRILYLSMNDMHLFTDLTTLDEAIFETVLPMIFSKFLSRIQEVSHEQFADPDPLSNRIFLYVCKSLQEVAEQLGTHIKTDNAIIYSEALGWQVAELQEESQTSYSKCLRQQLQMLAKLANHFDPGGPFRSSCFPYEFKLFQNMDAIPESVRIWLCILDDCMKDLVQADLDKMQMLSCFFKSYVSFVASEDFRSETLECLRTITHDALRSLADMASSQHDRTTSDSVLLEYNQTISCCLDKFPREQFGKECDQIETTLQKIICEAKGMNVSSDELLEFSNVFKQLLNELSDLQLEWFIRLTPSDKRSRLLQSQFIVPVGSIWKNTEYECFKVVDLEGIVEMFKTLHNSDELPKHYQLKVIQVLLQNVEKLTTKQNWTDGKHLSDKDLLGVMTYMINSIRDSLVLFNEQPDYHCFEDFLLKMSKPCAQVITGEVQDHPHIYAIEYEETLDPLLDRFEGSISKVLLSSGLKLYITQYNKYIVESSRLSREKRIEKIVSDVKSKTHQRINLATNWTTKFKRKMLPKLLAGLSAVWSLIVSENNSSSKKMTKPSLLHISCILSIFGKQSPDGSHQLLQLSTHEGKEFVLGLTAALLALYGHKVEIVCFNSHLTRIYSLDWIRVFRRFSILSNISYKTLQDMAWERSKGVYDKYTAYINECLGLESNVNSEREQKNASEDERSVLLIEDIDIILHQDIISFPYVRFVRPTIPGLMEMQLEQLCENEFLDGNKIVQKIKHSVNPNIGKLRTFLDRPHSYKIFDNDRLREVEYTNKTLFSQQYWHNGMKFTTDEYIYDKLSINVYFPYASLLDSVPLVLSFTNAPPNVSDKTFGFALNHYRICCTTSESNEIQTMPTKFDTKKDFLCVDDRDWMEAMLVAIKAAIDRNCLVLVFFNNARTMEQLQQTEYLEQLNVTAIERASYKANNIPDEISVLMVCKGYFTKDRQVHVVQTFFSRDGKEEDLIRRQAERSDRRGSYEFIMPRYSSYREKEEKTYKCYVEERNYSTDDEMKLFAANNSEKYKKFKKFLKLRTSVMDIAG